MGEGGQRSGGVSDAVVLITGGCGFLGVSTAARLLAQAPDRRIVLSDIVRHPRMERLSGDVTFVAADLSDPEASRQLVTRDVGTVFHYSRKGYVDGRVVRLPAIVVREPLRGRDYVCPVPPEVRMPILNVRNCVGVLIGMAELPPGALGDYRAINGPSIAPSAREIADAVMRRGREGMGKISFAPDSSIADIIATWPKEMRFERAEALGLPAPIPIDGIIDEYLAEKSTPGKC